MTLDMLFFKKGRKMRKQRLVSFTPYGSQFNKKDRRWGVTVLPKDPKPLFVVARIEPLEELPMGEATWEPSPPRRTDVSIEDLRSYFVLSQDRQKAMTFECPSDAEYLAVQIDGVGIEADCFEVDLLAEETETLHKS